ncbi:glycine cleavage system protein H [Streptomyces sp. NPDC059909]|uniref:glycine cleavage system protein H n=1 Tax=Streptomyces sp. NPDC059909 TaxID=3346998 RepID=UPI00365E35AA
MNATETPSADVRYSPDHLWLRREGTGDEVTVGITERIARILTLVNTVALPAPGASIAQGAELAAIDAQKAAFELPAPVAVRITAANNRLTREPLLVRTDPRGGGWLLRCTLARPHDWDQLLDHAAYQALVEHEQQRGQQGSN